MLGLFPRAIICTPSSYPSQHFETSLVSPPRGEALIVPAAQLLLMNREAFHAPEIVIETQRLILRRWRDGDEIIAAPIYAKPEVMQYIPSGTWDYEATTRIIARMQALENDQGFGFYPIVLKETGAIIGHAGLGYLERTKEVELAYVLDVQYWRRGLATEAARAILTHGFAAIGLERIVAVAFPENLRSVEVMKRCGMQACGLAWHFNREVVKYEARRGG
jgi:RimJ/RimL family protein N-acetyltransferase